MHRRQNWIQSGRSVNEGNKVIISELINDNLDVLLFTKEINNEIECSIDIYASRLKINSILVTFILKSRGIILHTTYVVYVVNCQDNPTRLQDKCDKNGVDFQPQTRPAV